MPRWIVLAIIVVLAAGCAPVAGTSAPAGTLSYSGPVEIKIAKGETMPGTRLQYVGNSPDGAQVSIDGQTSTRKVADSLAWKGEMAPGVSADMSGRILLIGDDQLTGVGTIQIVVSDATPQAGTVDTSAPVRFKVPVAYQVSRGTEIPGTRITYAGMSGQRAELGNVEGDQFRTIGQEITWSGTLRDKVWLKLDLRTVLFTANTLDLTGTAEVFIAP